MKSAIEQLFCGKLVNDNPDMSKEYWEAISVSAEKGEALLKLIRRNAEIRKAFEEYQDAKSEIVNEEGIALYKQGFRNGFWLALDVMKEE